MLHRGPQMSDDLSHRFDLLMNEYQRAKGKKVNSERQKFIKLIQSFGIEHAKSYDHQAALGICVYGLIKVDGGFNLFTVPKHKSHYRFFGSELGELLQQLLDIHYSNPLDDQQALIYLTALYHQVKKFPRHLDGTPAQDQESEQLVNDIEKYIKILLEQVAKKRPTYKALIYNFSEIPDKYKSLGGTDATRDKYAQFIRILNADLFNRYRSEAREDREWTDAYAVRYAAMLFVMEEIEKEYKYLSPEGGHLSKGSALYKICKPSLNIIYDTSKDITSEIKRKYYVDLLSYVLRINLQPNELQKWEELGFSDAKKFFDQLQNALAERVVDLIRVSKPGSVSLSYLDIVTSTAASYGVTIALGKIASDMSLHGKALTYFNLVKPEVALLITLLTYATKAIVLTKATNAVNSVIVATVSQPVMITFSSAKKLGEFCCSLFVTDKGIKSMQLVDNDAFMRAIISLPDNVFTPALKEKMKYVAAYKREELVIEGDKIVSDKLLLNSK